nr:DUF4381 domain-containing protein [Lysobacter sp. CAU 1642]
MPLRDIHLPPEPGWWPPAPGWWMLALCLVGVLILLAVLAWRSLQRARLRRQRLAVLEGLLREAGEPAIDRIRACAEALRRVAASEAPECARLNGEEWLAWLDRDLPGKPFSEGPGRALLDAPYRPSAEPQQAESLVRLVRQRLRGDFR